MNRRLHIVWPNDQTVTVYLENNPVADYYYNCIKHLQHVPLSFDQRSNSLLKVDIQELKNNIQELGIKLNVDIDDTKIETQEYLNFLHDIYFQNAKETTFDPYWLQFHDCIHLIEECINSRARHTQIWFDFQEKAGAFVKPFDRSWLQYSVTKVMPGDCITQEHELGKSLLLYKNNKEKLTINSLNQLAKPWYNLRPILDIELVERDPYQHFIDNDQEDFLTWFEPYCDAWCTHWGIKDWTPREMFAKISLGHIEDLTTLIDNFSQGYYPRYIKR